MLYFNKESIEIAIINHENHDDKSSQSRIKDDDTNRINESVGPVMNSTFQNDELRNTLKETVSEVLNDTGVLNGVRLKRFKSKEVISKELIFQTDLVPVSKHLVLAK